MATLQSLIVCPSEKENHMVGRTSGWNLWFLKSEDFKSSYIVRRCPHAILILVHHIL